MARPARSGTTHMMVEHLLLVRGWDEGWAYLLELAGNLSTLTARSYGVSDGLMNERFEIGLTIDFLAQSQRDTLDFRYGRPIVLTAAQVGVLEGGLASDQACDFVRMVLSRQGQMALLSPEISRIPYDASVLADVEDQLPDGISEALKLSWLDYDAKITSDRYWAVNVLFDVLISETLVTRRNLWRRFHAVEQISPPDAVRSLRTLLTTMPMSEEEAFTANVLIKDGSSTLTIAGGAEPPVVDIWRARTAEVLQRIEDDLRVLEVMARQ
jgi:hypothetical protein